MFHFHAHAPTGLLGLLIAGAILVGIVRALAHQEAPRGRRSTDV